MSSVTLIKKEAVACTVLIPPVQVQSLKQVSASSRVSSLIDSESVLFTMKQVPVLMKTKFFAVGNTDYRYNCLSKKRQSLARAIL